MKLLIVLAMTMAPAFGPEVTESYCVGIAPENCPYSWTLNDGRWWRDGNPQAKEPEDRSHDRQPTLPRGSQGQGERPERLGSPS